MSTKCVIYTIICLILFVIWYIVSDYVYCSSNDDSISNINNNPNIHTNTNTHTNINNPSDNNISSVNKSESETDKEKNTVVNILYLLFNYGIIYIYVL